MQPFLICIHDASPAFDRETRLMIRDLAPLVGRRLSFGVVPDWHGEWPLAPYPDYCRFIDETSDELLLHGYCHQRRQGRGPVSWLAEGCDEMNGLDAEETRRTIERGRRDFTAVFGAPARGFLAPGWQSGHVTPNTHGLEYLLGFFSLESPSRRIPLATWTWDCGRWGWLGHIGHGIGRLCHSPARIPTLAIHPRDLQRGFWPMILGLTQNLLDQGFEPSTPAGLLETSDVEVAV